MTEHPATPDQLAAAIADGTPVDWAMLAARAPTPEARARVARFALVARVAGVHADQHEPAANRASPPMREFAAGHRWGGLRIVTRLAAGTFGTVYRAHDPKLARDVALKILRCGDDTTVSSDAVAEGRLLARVRHPHVVAVYGADTHGGRAGVWMELIDGRTLEEELEARGRMPEAEVLRIGVDLASALQAVHDAGLLHRDVKTQNVMRDRDGRVVLMDFSAGRELSGVAARDPTLPASIAGSPLYLAPECFGGAPASVRSDLYGLGVLLHRLATGRYPVDGSSIDQLIAHHAVARPRLRLPALAASAPSLLPVVSRLLSPDPARRPARAADAAGELLGLVGGFSTRRRALVTASAVAASIVVAGLSVVAPIEWRATASRGVTADLRVTTGSVTAREAYLEAERLLQAVDLTPSAEIPHVLDAADTKLSAALEADPTFASASILRAKVAAVRGAGDQAVLRHVEQALADSAHVSAGERAFIDAVSHRLRADRTPDRRDELQAAARAYETVLRAVPGHYWSLLDLPAVYDRLHRVDDADRVASSGALYHPTSPAIASRAARVHLRTGDRQALRDVARRALDGLTVEQRHGLHRSSGAVAWLATWELRDAWMRADMARAVFVWRELWSGHERAASGPLLHMLAQAAMSFGRFDDARKAYARLQDPGERRFGLALADARQERWGALREVLAPGGQAPPPAERRFAFMYLMAGMVREAEELLPHLRRTRTAAQWQATQELEAQVRVEQGRYAEALALFAPLLADERAPRLYMQEQVALARRGIGDLTGAISILERFEAEPILVHVEGFAGHDWLRCLLRLAEFYRQQGRTEDARRAAGKARAMLRFADADHPFRPRLAALP